MPGDPNGITRRKSDEFVAKRRGHKDGLLLDKETEIPKGTAYLLNWYYEVANGEKLTNLEIEAWSRLNKLKLEPYEAQTLISLDRVRMRIQDEDLKTQFKN